MESILDSLINMVNVGFETPEEKESYEAQKVSYNKQLSRMRSEARKQAKQEGCYLCKSKCTSFCNSHSVPSFTLHRVANKGYVSYSLQGELPAAGDKTGVAQAGTFHVICEDCDNQLFQDYENPNAYTTQPTDKMLAQIALKNYLLLIAKRLEEDKFYKIYGEINPDQIEYAEEKRFIGDYDLKGFAAGAKYAQKAMAKKGVQSYYLCFYRVLDYVVPYAAQAAITLNGDFNDSVINNPYNFDSTYEMKEIQVAVFPLEKTSVVMMFIENGDKRYRNFYRQLRKLSPEDQLAAINYIIFANSENVFMNPTTHEKMKENDNFMKVCRQTTDTLSSVVCSPEVLNARAIKALSLSKRTDIPNLLSREYALE